MLWNKGNCYIEPENMSKLLVEKMFFPKGFDLGYSDSFLASDFPVEFDLRLIHLGVKEKPIIFTQLRSFRHVGCIEGRGFELSFHVIDELQEERYLLWSLFFLQSSDDAIVISFDEFALENLQRLDQRLVVLSGLR